MKKNYTLEQKERKAQFIATTVSILFVVLIGIVFIVGFYYSNEKDKKEKVEEVANLASQYTVSGTVEKIILKKVKATNVFKNDTEECYLLINNKRYKVPSSFTEDVHKGSQVTLVGDRNGVSTMEIEQ